MIIIGMTGPIGHGKSTFASAVSKLEPKTVRFESSMIIAEVANAMHERTKTVPSRDDIESINEWLKMLPEILARTVHANCAFDQIKLDYSDALRHPIEYEKLFLHLDNLSRSPELLTTKVTKENKENYRPFLQWLGGYLVKRVDPGIWYEEIIRRVAQQEAEGYKVCLIGGLRFPNDAAQVRAAGGTIIKVYRPGHLQFDMLDPTERERENVEPDSTIVSNGGVEDVDHCAAFILKDIQDKKLQRIYYTLDYKNKQL